MQRCKDYFATFKSDSPNQVFFAAKFLKKRAWNCYEEYKQNM